MRRPQSDRNPLIWRTPTRTLSHSSLDPNEDPVTGLERVSSSSNLYDRRKREERLREQEGRLRRRHKRRSVVENEHTLSEKYESLDYEIVENELYRAAEMSKDHQKNLFRRSVNRWVVCFLIGVFTALVASCIDVLVYYNSKLKFHIVINGLVQICEHGRIGDSGCTWIILFTWALYNCVLVSVAAFLVLFVSPVAIGSGIPQIKCFLNGVQIPGVVRLKTLVAKVIGVSCSVGGGLAAGKEGPMIHSGAVVAAGISQGRCVSIPFDSGLFKYFRNDHEKRDFVSAGAAAGVSAAFAAPIGGVLFSLEEGASFWNQSLTWRMVFTAMISTFTLNCFISFFYGQFGQLSWNGLANFGTFESKSYGIWELPLFALVGLFGGLSGAFFNFLNMKLSRFRKNYIRTKRQRFLECMLVATASAFIGFITLLLIDDCQSIGINPQLTGVMKLWCPKGKYSAIATLFFQNPEESVKSLFHSPLNSFNPLTLFVFALEYYILTMWTYGLSVPSGIFIPSLLTGAAWGRLFGAGVQYFFPELEAIDSGKYALAGAAAQLGGIVRMTISLTAIIVEATKDITFGLPIMLVLMIAKWVGDWFNEGIYDEHINLSEVPILSWEPPKLSRNILAKNVMRRDVIALERIESVSRIVEILRSTRHHGFPVLDRIDAVPDDSKYPNYGHLLGFVLRSHLIVLLKKKHFTLDYEGRNSVSNSKPVTLSDFSEFYPRVESKISDLGLNSADERCWIDLKPFMHPSPHRVPLSASLNSIHQVFRGLGLRFLVVVDNENRLRGIITRKDIARFKERRVKNTFLVNELYISPYSN
ncbi:Chloride transporter, ClC family [Meloidogyne graminicola]|uniref:Chloride channel protein n=1 Tax=Meloidogyne graminicola TaxID=189291 RepID=A0A8T0A1P9_9BILA|nr:Chloride transporter, ClC family [Meloidogyne graminicola]